MEFLVWTEFIQQSRGLLHIFLPLLDSGLDAVIHRMTDGEYIPVQIKGRSLDRGYVQIAVRADSLVDDRALIIAGLLTNDGLGPTLLVVDERNFKRLAAREVKDGVEMYAAAFSMQPSHTIGRWVPYLVPRSGLGARMLGRVLPAVKREAPTTDELAPRDRHNQWLGFLGESEVVRRIAEISRLDVFRPFPDLEMVEVLVRNNVSGRFAGLQVKTAIPGREYGEAQINVRKATLVAAPSTYVIGLAWLPQASGFADECLLIPSQRLSEVADDGGDRWVLLFHPASKARTRLDPYRHRLSALGTLIAKLTEQL